jgi:hypothetical protein
LLTLVAILVLGAAVGRGEEKLVDARVSTMLSAYADGRFMERTAPTAESGWSLTLPSGRVVTRSFLQYQAEPLVALGKDAVPALASWVGAAKDPATRYIAIYALGEITGRRPPLPHLAAPDREALRRATQEWLEAVKE